MGLLDQIAQGGNSKPIDNYLQGKQEKRAAKLDDLRYKMAQRNLDEFDKGSSLRDLTRNEQERKLQPEYIANQEKSASEMANLEKDKIKSTLSKDEAYIAKMNEEVKQFKTEADLQQQEEKDSTALNIMDSLYSQYKNDPAALKNAIISQKDKLLELGTDSTDAALQQVLSLDDNQLASVFPKILQAAPVSREMRRKAWLESKKTSSGGSSEFERLNYKKQKGTATQDDIDRMDMLTGTRGRAATIGTQERHEDRVALQERGIELRQEGMTEKKATTLAKKETNLRKEADKGVKHFKKMGSGIDGALAAIASGNNGLSEVLLSQVLSQVQDGDVRAFQMYKEFDKSIGNVGERTFRGAIRWVTGERTGAEQDEIVDTLKHFRDNYVIPGQEKVKGFYRGLATDSKVDKYRVVPPASKEEIRDDKSISMERKIELLKNFYPQEFE